MPLPIEHFPLDRAFLLGREAQLCELLKPFMVFRDHNIYFPPVPVETRLLAAERQIFAPIQWFGKYVGALRLSGVQPQEARSVLPFLADIIALCLQNIVIAEAAKRDNETGLICEEAFFEKLTEQIARQTKPAELGKSGCFGLIILQWPDAEQVGRRAGYQLKVDAWRKMAETMQSALPEDAVTAYSGKNEWLHEFAIWIPAFGRGGCHALARRIMTALQNVQIVDPFSTAHIQLFLSAGHVMFPHDLQGADLRRPAREQALLLRDRARLAAQAAARRPKRPVLAFAWLLRHGGIVLEILRHNRLRISLGHASYAQNGMRFYVFGPEDKRCKAQIVIREASEADSLAEVFHQEAAMAPPQPGDRLVLFQRPLAKADNKILEHITFFERFAQERHNWRNFILSISRIQSCGSYRAAARNFAERLREQIQRDTEDITRTLPGQRPVFAGFYGIDGIAVFWPGWHQDDVRTVLQNIHASFDENGEKLASGIFAYPCLNFSKAESEACCLKSLEYAELLPAPHIGVLDDLALTISGDKRISQGDELGAMEDYRKALMLNPHNAMTLNSLAVCLAAMNRPKDAIDQLEKALAAKPNASLRANICYNLANIYLREAGTEETAKRYYKHCIQADPNHAYAWLRLGQIYARQNKPGVARAMYRHTERLAGNDTKLVNIARRQLARLAEADRHTEDARDILHDSLLLNPADTDTLLQLARSYLADDPGIAETLARKCLRLGSNAAFTILAEALAKQGRHTESQEVSKKFEIRVQTNSEATNGSG